MSENKNRNWFQNNVEDLQIQVEGFLQAQKKTNFKKESLKITIIYLVLGGLWIALSDNILSALIQNSEIYKIVQLYKGWLYVGITAILLYLIISNRMKLFQIAMQKIYDTYEELAASHEELIAMEGTLNEQYDQLKDGEEELIISNQRYKMVIEGSNDGIWDWDILKDEYFFSIGYKEQFGYKEDLDTTLDSWTNLMHPDDRERVAHGMIKYLENKEDLYSDTYQILTKDGNYRWIASRGKALWNEEGKPIYMAGSHTDITEQKNMEKKLYELAYYDQLTKLPNMYWLKERSEELIQEVQKQNKNIALLYVDIDDFRNINETMGHEIGDKLIIHMSDNLKKLVKAPSLIARFGGDEFGVLLVFDIHREEFLDEIQRSINYLKKPWNENGYHFFITISVGVAVWPEHGEDFSSLLQSADMALSDAKEKGKDGYSLFDQSMKEKPWQFVQMDTELRVAIQNQEFQLYYQPLFDIKENKIIGAETLIRWHHPKKGFISPMEFIPFAEKFGYIESIDRWVFEMVCKQKNIWKKEGYVPLKISINLSGKMFTYKNLMVNMKEILDENNIEKDGIELEITETAIMIDTKKEIQTLEDLKCLDVTVALDDFGTGYSSLTYLKDLPIDVIKIDREFINGIGKSDKESNIVRHLIELAHSLNLKVIAEGVETKEQLNFLKENNCDIAQGYLLAKPMPASEMENYFTKE